MLSKNSIFLESSVSVTYAFFTSGRLPCVVPNDYRAIVSAIATLGPVPVEEARPP